MPGRMEFEFGSRPSRDPRQPTTPMRILVLGNFGGERAATPEPDSIAEREILAVDVDTLDQVLGRLAPRIGVPLGPRASRVEIQFAELEDFHPDALHDRLGLFQELRRTRERDPASFAAEESGSGSPPEEKDATTLERLLGSRPVERAGERGADVEARAAEGIAGFLREVVAPHIVPAPDLRQEQWAAGVDAAIAEHMRAILSHPATQALEAAWRGLHWLLTNLESDEHIEVHLLDASREELVADLAAGGGDLSRAGLLKRLAAEGRGVTEGPYWSLIVGDLRFGAAAGDVALLAALGAISASVGAPFLAAAADELLGCESLAGTPDPASWNDLDGEAASRWEALRASAVAPWIGLALPRILLRLPYGTRSDEIERFPFEELAGGDEHSAYLWGNPAHACALLLARDFLARGWAMQPGEHLQIEGLPAHTYAAEAGGVKLKACAEVCMGERAAETILRRGLMPIMSYRDRNAVRLLRSQSLAEPPCALAGRWS